MINPVFYEKRFDGVDLYQRTSTLGVKLRQVETGVLYDDPIDIDPCPYTYEETDIPIDVDPEQEKAQKAEAYDYITGRSDGNE